MDEIWSIEMAMGRGSVHDNLPMNVIRTDQPDFTSEAQAGPWWGILTHMGGVTHPPLYFVVLRWWIDLAGTRRPGGSGSFGDFLAGGNSISF